MEQTATQSAAAKENKAYLENNELNKLIETLMIQISTHKPDDIVWNNM